MKSLWFVIVAAAFYLFVVALFWPYEKQLVFSNTSDVDTQGYAHARIQFSDTSITVQIPTTSATQELGLGGRRLLNDNEGMYWQYPTPERPSFWMKGMLIPLDFIWLNNGQVVEVEADVPPPSNPTSTDLPIIQPDVQVDGVLEVSSGFIQRHGIQVGDVARVDVVTNHPAVNVGG